MVVDLTGIDKRSARELKKIMPILDEINGLADYMAGLSDDALREKRRLLSKRLSSGETLDDILPDAFALVREASRRTIGLYPFDVQILGGIELYRGKISEMKTGEGKTLVAAMPSFLMALTGNGVHVVTVNDYLAKRDAADIGRIHRFLGLSVGCITHDMSPMDRQKAYACDITYITNTELGFDYLRDNMVTKPEMRTQRGLSYCIIDEVDSILIDEARTPLIISGAETKETDIYVQCDRMARSLKAGVKKPDVTKVEMLSGVRAEENGDYIVDEKERTVHLTDVGVRKIEKTFGIVNYADSKHADLRHHLQMALQAYGLMHKDKDYIVKDGEIIIVDEFTGRMMQGRVFADGLHQAIEAKEGVTIHPETDTMATITYQNFFNKYDVKSGMTGTAKTSADEFRTIYSLDVVVIPTNKPMIRVDEADEVYLLRGSKRRAIVMAIDAAHKKGQPVLVGTATISESEILSKHLKDFGIPHVVLNAKYHEQEAEIISHAGEPGHITIATNMAGRGTDIKLTDESRALGGLFVIGTERHEARRIDNQLRGRSGRQGDPGRSKFFLSLDDDVMRLFGSSKAIESLKAIGLNEWDPIEQKSVASLVDKAQRKIETTNFGLRKSLLDFDNVNNEHRELIYAQRNAILNGGDPTEAVSAMVKQLVGWYYKRYFGDIYNLGRLSDFEKEWKEVFPDMPVFTKNANEMYDNMLSSAMRQFNNHFDEFETKIDAQEALRYVLLRCIDRAWIAHLNMLEQLRQAVNFVGYGQKNPVVVYKDKAYDAFEDTLRRIQHDTVMFWFKTKPFQALRVTKPTV